ncbi:MAG: Aminodeoxyfutalosine deaminase [Syntrophorhabdaceae bacterium PtaU1.Bin034]|nr:MAG: Aminodeoxyfutalosine deaminase [Syntrophorhabdaceae bacterium PtaU1.Bin034]
MTVHRFDWLIRLSRALLLPLFPSIIARSSLQERPFVRLIHHKHCFPSTAVLILLLLIGACSGPGSGWDVAAYLESIRNDPVRLEAFVRDMPKGGDVHTHLSGVPYAESYLQWAANDGMCISTTSWLITNAPCSEGSSPVTAVLADPVLYNLAIDGLSMRNFPLYAPLFGHDHFFAAFSLFGAVSGSHKPDMLAEAATRAAADNTDYLELLITFQSAALNGIADATPWTGDMETDYQSLLQYVREILPQGAAEMDDLMNRTRTILACSGSDPPAACRVTIRFIQQANRTSSDQRVFASLLFGAEMSARDPRLVGVDLVSPEDSPAALTNYSLHMQMLSFLKTKYPHLNIALHAGELTANLVGPADLSFHISQAVRTAGARRIGHGVSLKSETEWQDLLAEMARNRIGVAVLLTSNAQILGVTGEDHPFRSYLDAGVPVMLSTDDQGISRGSHTGEFIRAITTYGLTWNDIKRLVRTSMECAFIRGGGLWKVPFDQPVPVDACAADQPGSAVSSPDCQAYLHENDKAAEQWRLEHRLSIFENRHW